MNEILRQLGELVLGSVPTIILFLMLVTAYGLLVRRPLARVLTERHARTTGAVEQARGAISAAEAETAVYEDKIRTAKAEIFQLRQEKMKQWNAERETALGEVRKTTQDKIGAARSEIELSATNGRHQIEGISGELSAQVLRAVMPAGFVASEAAQ